MCLPTASLWPKATRRSRSFSPPPHAYAASAPFAHSSCLAATSGTCCAPQSDHVLLALSVDCLWRVVAAQLLAAGCTYVWPTVCLALQKANVSSVKYQVCRLIRMLVHICKTLDSMPAEVRWAFTAVFSHMSFASIDVNTKFLGFVNSSYCV